MPVRNILPIRRLDDLANLELKADALLELYSGITPEGLEGQPLQ